MTPALFASISGSNKAVLDELEAYLEAPPLSTVEDPLVYWDLVLKTSPSSLLATMVIDFLTAQGTSHVSNRAPLAFAALTTFDSHVDRLGVLVLQRPPHCITAVALAE